MSDMAEYIEKQKVINWFSQYGHTEEPIPFETLVADLRGMKSEDVSPVVHGRWEHNSDFPDRFICYGCGAMFDMWKHEQRLFNYCPNCGAKMDGEIDE